ncbi:C39 family peptidase [Candidatus Sumerlaeota bacterium]|nr:C39 family peptidase [Candidatus Sumerlaeota bacterium]
MKKSSFRIIVFLVLLCLWLPLYLVSSSSEDLILINDVPHVKQKPDFCGEACISMYLQKLGFNISQDQVFNISGADPALGRGLVTIEMKTALDLLGFKPGNVWYKVQVKNLSKDIDGKWKDLLSDLKKGIPSIICRRTSDKPRAAEHFVLVLGFDAKTDEAIYHDPAVKNGAYLRMKRKTLLDLLPLKYEKDQWTIIRFRLEADRIEAPDPVKGLTSADFVQQVMKMKTRLPGEFHFVIEPPFIVIGDESLEMVKTHALRTVKTFSDAMKKQYFPLDPVKTYEIWLFKDSRSYRKYSREIFGNNPDTPYGYCSSTHSALVMNIATGGGTLCHEIVHAFMPSNFPECPSWFNEGLASLYEQCAFREGKAYGMTNWRLAGLQNKIKEERLPSFKTLCSTTTHEFYSMRSGDNYAQARYLLYYLQEKGVLEQYYRQFKSNVALDPTGYDTLKKILGEEDMNAFRKKWEQYVLALAFP